MARPRTISLIESVQQSHGKLVVDRTAGVIRGVKYLGMESPNKHGQTDVEGTEYTREAIRESKERYNGRQVFLDHPAGRNAGAERSVRDLAGVIRECRDEDGGGYCELHYVKGTPNGELLASLAESHPELIGLSHNADGVGRRDPKRKRYVIESIPNVRSVDIVTRPATTKSLYESQEPSVKTLKQLIEERKLEKIDGLVKLLEDEGMPMDSAPAPAAAEADGWRTHLANAITAVVQDTELDEAAVKAKVMAILKLMKDEEKAEPKEPDTGDEPTKTEESRELETLRKEKSVRTLCESLSFAPTEKQLTLLAKHDEAEQKELVTAFKGSIVKTGPRSNGIGPKPITESREVPKDSKARAAFLKSYRG